jgi:hypothetical protein
MRRLAVPVLIASTLACGGVGGSGGEFPTELTLVTDRDGQQVRLTPCDGQLEQIIYNPANQELTVIYGVDASGYHVDRLEPAADGWTVTARGEDSEGTPVEDPTVFDVRWVDASAGLLEWSSGGGPVERYVDGAHASAIPAVDQPPSECE